MIKTRTGHCGIWRTPSRSGRVDRAGSVPCVIIAREMLDTTQGETAPPQDEPRGCLFALSQPPLMIFLAVIGCLLLMAALHDLLLL
ncbi:hypothetical protein [Streptomyces davaonensis]|nr:hypothetical protein [Streptomyces davaonensis]